MHGGLDSTVESLVRRKAPGQSALRHVSCDMTVDTLLHACIQGRGSCKARTPMMPQLGPSSAHRWQAGRSLFQVTGRTLGSSRSRQRARSVSEPSHRFLQIKADQSSKDALGHTEHDAETALRDASRRRQQRHVPVLLSTAWDTIDRCAWHIGRHHTITACRLMDSTKDACIKTKLGQISLSLSVAQSNPQVALLVNSPS